MILRCADGLTNKAVAAEIGVHEHTVGKCRRRFRKERRGLGPASAGTAADAHAIGWPGLSSGRSPRRRRTHPLVAALDGQGKRPFGTTIWRIWGAFEVAAASLGEVKIAIRTSWTRSGHRRPLSVAAGPRAGARRRREEPDRRSTARSRSCRCCRVCLSGARTITSVTARPAVRSPRCRHRLRHAARHRRHGPGSFSLEIALDRGLDKSSWTTTPPTRRSGLAPAAKLAFSADVVDQSGRALVRPDAKQLQRGVPARPASSKPTSGPSSTGTIPKPFKWTKSADDILAAVKRFCLRVEQNLCHEL